MRNETEVMLGAFELPVRFDPVRLQTDLNGMFAAEFLPHFNTQYYEGNWSVAPLRSIGGAANQIYPDPTKGDSFADTPLLARCPYVIEALSFLQCPLLSVRFLRLAAGSVIKEHRDYNLSLEDGELRLHVPVVTNPEVEFILNGHRVVMKEGECWYLNFDLPHQINNNSTIDGIHLVIDARVNDWVKPIFSDPGITIKKEIEDPSSNFDTATRKLMIQRFREMNTPTGHALADELEQKR